MNPETGTPRQQERRERILMAAAEEFLGQSDDSRAVDCIAARAQASKATIYRYFGDKTGLELAMVEWLCQRAGDQLRSIVVSRDQPKVTLRALGQCFLEGVLSTQVLELHRYVVGRSGQHPALGDCFWHQGPDKVYQAAADIIAQLNLPAHLANLQPRQLAEMYLDMLTGRMQLQYLCSQKQPEEGERSERIEQALMALGFDSSGDSR